MDKAIISYQNDLNGIRAGRASINMLDTIKVEVYGNKTSLNQVGNVSVPEARLITISIWDSNNVSTVEKAIRDTLVKLMPGESYKLLDSKGLTRLVTLCESFIAENKNAGLSFENIKKNEEALRLSNALMLELRRNTTVVKK